MSSFSGPNSFAKRLAEELINRDYILCEDDYSIFLCFIEEYQKPEKRSLKIQRLDGFWSTPDAFKRNQNDSIKRIYESYDRIIVQSEHDKKYIEEHFGKRNNTFVIGNGINLDLKIEPYKRKSEEENELWFVSSAQWHPQKRLCDNIRLFQKIRKQTDKNCKLFLLGSNINNEIKYLKSSELENVTIVGNVDYNSFMSLYQSCDWCINLEFIGHCPNVLCEMLACNVPIIYASDGGGVKELVKDNGLEVLSSKDFNYKLCDYNNPEKEGYILDLDSFVFSEVQKKIIKNNIDIKNIAEQYIKVFTS